MNGEGPREFGVVQSDELNDKSPLNLAAQFVDDFMRRDRHYPSLKEQLEATRHEFHPPSEAGSDAAPFVTTAISLPVELQGLKETSSGILPSMDLIWIASGRTAYLWDYRKQDSFKMFAEMDENVTGVHCASPKKGVFVETVENLIVLTTAKSLKIFAVTGSTFYDTGFSVNYNFAAPPVFANIPERIVFTVNGALFEVEYRAKESWFKSKVQINTCGGAIGSGWFQATSEESASQISVDLSRSKIYTLCRNTVACFDCSNGIRFEHNLPSQKQKIVGFSAFSKSQAADELLVLIAESGDRLYIREHNQRQEVVKKPPTEEKLKVTRAVAYDGSLFVMVVENGIFASYVDSARLIHLVDQHAALALPEVAATILPSIRKHKSISLAQISPPQRTSNEAVLQYCAPAEEFAVLTGDALYLVRRKHFYEIMERESRLPANLPQIYGHIELCCAALCVATRPSMALAKPIRDQALNNYYRLGGIPVFQKDIEANRYTYVLDPKTVGSKQQKVGIRLSSSFDGLACYTSRMLVDVWDTCLFSYTRKGNKLVDLKLNVDRLPFEILQANLKSLSQFLESSKPADTKLDLSLAIGDTSLLNQAEQKSVAAMAQLVKSCQQGIAFLLLLKSETAGSGLESLMEYVSKDLSDSLLRMTFRSFFSEAKYSAVARELVTCLINFIINRGDSIDSVARVIQDRCETYCSASDVLVYKALQYLHSAKSSPENDLKVQKLYKSSSLFVKAAGNISYDTLKDILSEYEQMDFYPGAVSVTLAAANEIDPTNVGLSYLRDQKPENDARQKIYQQKIHYYDLILPMLAKIDIKPGSELYSVLVDNKDEVFQDYLYDWFLNHKPELLNSMDTPFILAYLQGGATRDVRIAELLWKFFLRKDDLLAAADVLLDLAKGTLKVPMIQRVELLSRAMGYCKCQFPPSQQQQVFELGTMVSAYLKIANVQAEVLDRVTNDRLQKEEVRIKAQTALNEKLLTVSELFNEFAEPLHYYDLCLLLFEIADFTDPVEIMQCYERLLESLRLQDATEGTLHYNHVAALLASLGRRFTGVSALFPVGQLRPYLERYSELHCPDAPKGWVQQAFQQAGY